MSGTRVAERRSRTRNKILAISAAGAVLAAGVTIPSLAAWTDSEWVVGGAGTEAGVSTSEFNLQQWADGDADWGDYAEAGPNVINFGPQAATLSPGTTTYAYVRLAAAPESVAGTVELQAETDVAVNALAAALQYGARFVDAAADCTPTGFAESTDILVASGSALSVDGADDFAIAAGGEEEHGPEVVVCFELTLPTGAASTLQGLEVSPLWQFVATSVS